MRNERGQILIILAAGLLFVMLSATALAVDWGNGLLQKRRLQNVADGAALAAAHELSRGGIVADAISAAQGMVNASTGGSVSLAYTGSSLGANLMDGIEIDGLEEVRVALVRQVPTYFAPVLGVNSLTVRVRSRASVGPFGVLPIAMKRFSSGNTAFPIGEGGNPSALLDYLAPAQKADGTPNYLTPSSGWPSPLTAAASPSAGYTAPDSYNPRVSGPIAPLIGHDALANVANNNDFHFFVALDVRDITHPTMRLFNGVTLDMSVQQLKDAESAYFLSKGYPGPNPRVGDQLAAFSGTNTSHTVDAMRKVYRRGDVVTAVVYDGTVYRKPEFDIYLDSPVKTSGDISRATGSPVDFQVTLVPKNNFNSAGVQFSAAGLDSWGDWSFEPGPLNSTYTAAVPSGSISLTFSVSSDSEVSGARTAVVRAHDPASGTTRTASATVVVGGSDDESFSVACAEAFKVVEQSSTTRFDLDLRGWHDYGPVDVVADPPQWYTNANPPVPTTAPSLVSVSYSDSTVRVRDGNTANFRVTVSVAAGAPTGQWMMKVPFRDPVDSTRNQSVFVAFQIVPSTTSPTVASTTSFVNVLGFANFVITDADNDGSHESADNNTIYAYAVSGLISDPALLGLGTRARLMGWNQPR